MTLLHRAWPPGTEWRRGVLGQRATAIKLPLGRVDGDVGQQEQGKMVALATRPGQVAPTGKAMMR